MHRVHRRPVQLVVSALTVLVSFAGEPVSAQAPVPELAQRIDSLAAATLESGPIAGLSIAVVRGADTIVLRGYGLADIENDVPATAQTVYRIGSITKQFTALAVMQLAAQGAIRLDDELTAILPTYPTQGHRVTVDHLLTHTSGIKSYTGLGEKWRKTIPLNLSHEELLALFENEPFDFAPGERFQYNNSGFYLLGMIIEEVTGQEYADYVQERIFDPLGMESSRYCDERSIIKHRAEGYARANGELVNDAPIGMSQPGAAGALCSSVIDLVKWQHALNTYQLLDSAAYRRMVTPALLNDSSHTSYGYGLAIGEFEGHRRIGHGGGINGFNTQLDHYPDDSLTIAVLANTEGANPGRLARQIARLTLDIAEPTVLDLPLDPTARERYVGTYDLGELQVRIYEEGEVLMAQATGQGPFEILHQGNHTFVGSIDREIRLVFEVDGNRASAFTLHQGGMTRHAPRIP